MAAQSHCRVRASSMRHKLIPNWQADHLVVGLLVLSTQTYTCDILDSLLHDLLCLQRCLLLQNQLLLQHHLLPEIQCLCCRIHTRQSRISCQRWVSSTESSQGVSSSSSCATGGCSSTSWWARVCRGAALVIFKPAATAGAVAVLVSAAAAASAATPSVPAVTATAGPGWEYTTRTDQYSKLLA